MQPTERTSRLESGILLIDKPQGLTSHDVVARVRRLAGTRKVGHAGTLDPMATGLLTIGVNSSTRLLTHLVGLDKEYVATIRLGAATTTDDAEGEIVEESSPERLGAITIEAIDDGIAGLTGRIEQVPSRFSAIKIDGRRAYDRARAGEDVVLPSRSVTVSEFVRLEVRRERGLHLDVRVACSSGTYIRALARDLGSALGVGGHLTALRRTRVGPFRVERSTPLSELDPVAARLEPTAVARELFPVVDVTEAEVTYLAQGKRIPTDRADTAGPVAAVGPDGRLVALVDVVGGALRVITGFPATEVLA